MSDGWREVLPIEHSRADERLIRSRCARSGKSIAPTSSIL